MNPPKNKPLSLEERVAHLEKIILGGEYSPKKSGNIEKIVIDNVDKISIPHLIIIALFLKRKQTKQEITKMLEDWGKVVGNWFHGGNLNNRLLKKGIIKKDGINDKKEDLFSLTGKGENVAKKLIEKTKSK